MTPLECGIIFDGIPEGAISRKVGLIWGIPAYRICDVRLLDGRCACPGMTGVSKCVRFLTDMTPVLYSPSEDQAGRSWSWMLKIVPVPIDQIDGDIQEAVTLLEAGGVVVLPTDTLYGLGASVFSVNALERVFAIKGRPLGLALPVLVSSREQVKLVARFTGVGVRLADRFWPGPLTLVLRKLDRLPDLVTGGRDTVAVRMPDHRVPLALAEQLGGPVTGTSANLSGGPDLHTLETIQAQLGGRVDYTIRTGPKPKGIPSTVVDVTDETPRLVRQGALPFPEVLAALD